MEGDFRNRRAFSKLLHAPNLHIERCKALIHLIDITNEDLEKNYQQVKNELVSYSKNLLEKKEIIILNKTDLLDSTEIKRIHGFLTTKLVEPGLF